MPDTRKSAFARAVKEARLKCKENNLKEIKKILQLRNNQEATQVLQLLKNERMQIENIETFLSANYKTEDISLEIYKKTKTPVEFFKKAFNYFREVENSGVSYIKIREFILVVTDLISSKKIKKESLEFYLDNLFILACPEINRPCYNIQIVDVYLKKKIERITGLNLRMYGTVLKTFLKILKEHCNDLSSSKIPKITLLLGVYENLRELQIAYLVNTFSIAPERIKTLSQHIDNLSEDTQELRVFLESLAIKRNYENFDIEPVILQLKEMAGKSVFNRFYLQRDITDNFQIMRLPRADYKKYHVTSSFINAELFLKNYQKIAKSNVIVDCKNIKEKRIEELLGYAKEMCLCKDLALNNVERFSKKKYNDRIYKITLVNVDVYTQDFINELCKKLKNIRSLINKDIIIEVEYNPEVARQKIELVEPTYIRIISDIHADINKNQNYLFNFKNDFVIDCGDTAGDAITSTNWLKANIKAGVAVAGNHLGYSPACTTHVLPILYNLKINEQNTKNMQSRILAEFLNNTKIKYLSNKCTFYQGMAILGTTLFTDFCLFGEEHREECIRYAKMYMNDFKLPTIYRHTKYILTENGWERKFLPKGEGYVEQFSPNDHAYYFHYSMEFLKERVKYFKDKNIIIVTHHAPSMYSVASQYKNDPLSAAFASNLNEFIINNPQIRLWVHGHCHTPFDYILGETRVVCEPFGYYNENNYKLPEGYGKRIKIADIKSKESWKEILKSEIKKGIIQAYDT